MKNPITSNYFQLLPILFLVIFFACKEEEPTLEPNQQTEVSKIDTKENSTGRTKASGVNYVNDWSGQVQVAIFWEDKGLSQGPNGYVTVPPDYVLVGGGAETWDVQAGAYLTESRPDWINNRWYARSKDHKYVDAHYLRIYAIGLKIQDVTSSTLRSVMNVQTFTSTRQPHPATFAYIPSPYILIGGGAKANWTTKGSLLFHSYPSGNGWYVASKDHIYSESCTITAWAIGIQDYIPGFGYIDVTLANNSTINYVPTGWNTSTITGTGESVPVCIGGLDSGGDYGRMLTTMKPRLSAFDDSIVKSKDLDYPISGTLYPYLTLIRKRH